MVLKLRINAAGYIALHKEGHQTYAYQPRGSIYELRSCKGILLVKRVLKTTTTRGQQ